MMANGKMNGYICQGFNPLQAFPNKAKSREALGKLKWLVVMDPLDTETSRFWEKHGEKNPADPAKIQTEVFQLPTTCFAEEDGSLVNSACWLQWHWKAAEGPARHTQTSGSCPTYSAASANSTARKAACSPTRFSTSSGPTPIRSSRILMSSPRR
jgi:anaerobic selenocysteine-containing dehydrogenase